MSSRLVIKISIAMVKFIDWWLKMSIAVIEIIDWWLRLSIAMVEIIDCWLRTMVAMVQKAITYKDLRLLWSKKRLVSGNDRPEIDDPEHLPLWSRNRLATEKWKGLVIREGYLTYFNMTKYPKNLLCDLRWRLMIGVLDVNCRNGSEPNKPLTKTIYADRLAYIVYFHHLSCSSIHLHSLIYTFIDLHSPSYTFIDLHTL